MVNMCAKYRIIKRVRGVLLIAAVLIFGAFTVCYTFGLARDIDALEASLAGLSTSLPDAPERSPRYLMISTNMHSVEIYDAASGRLLEVVSITPFSLPQKDRDQLNKGIYLYSREELEVLISDFTS